MPPATNSTTSKGRQHRAPGVAVNNDHEFAAHYRPDPNQRCQPGPAHVVIHGGMTQSLHLETITERWQENVTMKTVTDPRRFAAAVLAEYPDSSRVPRWGSARDRFLTAFPTDRSRRRRRVEASPAHPSTPSPPRSARPRPRHHGDRTPPTYTTEGDTNGFPLTMSH